MLKLMYITNNPEVAKIAEKAGVDRIFVDMEYIGKEERQKNMSTVKSHHTIDDVKRIKDAVCQAQVVVRVNPIHDESLHFVSSEEEINNAIKAGADLVMLPYFQNKNEVEKFIGIVNGKAKVFPLFESKKAYDNVDEILTLEGIDEIHIGINDLSLDFCKKFMFELLADGTVEYLCDKFKMKGFPYGFGGIGRIGAGELPAEYIIKEHYRLGSTCAILSRSFCNANTITDLNKINDLFCKGIGDIRNFENNYCNKQNDYEENFKILKERVLDIIKNKTLIQERI